MTEGETLERVPSAKIARRNNHRLETAMRTSRPPTEKTLTRFDLVFRPSVKRQHVESLRTSGLLTCQPAKSTFVEERAVPPPPAQAQHSHAHS